MNERSERVKDVWVVSGISKDARPTVTVFNNEGSAIMCARYFNKAGYANVEVEHAPVFEKFLWDGHDQNAEPVHVKEKGVPKENREYVKIYCCGDCIHYNWKKDCCRRGANVEGKPTDYFYRDCPMGLNEEEVVKDE